MSCARGATAWSYNWTAKSDSTLNHTATKHNASMMGFSCGRHTFTNDLSVWGDCEQVLVAVNASHVSRASPNHASCDWVHCPAAEFDASVIATTEPCNKQDCTARIQVPATSVGDSLYATCQHAETVGHIFHTACCNCTITYNAPILSCAVPRGAWSVRRGSRSLQCRARCSSAGKWRMVMGCIVRDTCSCSTKTDAADR